LLGANLADPPEMYDRFVIAGIGDDLDTHVMDINITLVIGMQMALKSNTKDIKNQ
jgi:hypothetical protein